MKITQFAKYYQLDQVHVATERRKQIEYYECGLTTQVETN